MREAEAESRSDGEQGKEAEPAKAQMPSIPDAATGAVQGAGQSAAQAEEPPTQSAGAAPDGSSAPREQAAGVNAASQPKGAEDSGASEQDAAASGQPVVSAALPSSHPGEEEPPLEAGSRLQVPTAEPGMPKSSVPEPQPAQELGSQDGKEAASPPASSSMLPVPASEPSLPQVAVKGGTPGEPPAADAALQGSAKGKPGEPGAQSGSFVPSQPFGVNPNYIFIPGLGLVPVMVQPGMVPTPPAPTPFLLPSPGGALLKQPLPAKPPHAKAGAALPKPAAAAAAEDGGDRSGGERDKGGDKAGAEKAVSGPKPPRPFPMLSKVSSMVELHNLFEVGDPMTGAPALKDLEDDKSDWWKHYGKRWYELKAAMNEMREQAANETKRTGQRVGAAGHR